MKAGRPLLLGGMQAGGDAFSGDPRGVDHHHGGAAVGWQEGGHGVNLPEAGGG
jgi:hypothetical protein